MSLAAIPARARDALCFGLVLAIALCCYVVNRADPPRIFWDENYHVTSVERYLDGIAQFEPHPPLGLMLMAAGEALLDANAHVDKRVLTTTKQIGGDQVPKGFSFAGVRFMPSLFAALGALAFFGLMRELLRSRVHALLLSSLYLFENAFVVHFRAAHLDGFQIFFAIAALWLFVHLWRSAQPLRSAHYAALSALCAAAILVKVNAVFLLFLFPILYFKDARTQGVLAPLGRVLDFLLKSGVSVLVLVLVAFMVFYVHASIARQLPDANTASGRQDLSHMSPRYRVYLEQHQALTPTMVAIIARDYYRFMDQDHRRVPKLDTAKPGETGSHPLHWPFHDRNINYRWDSDKGKTAYVELVGNQFSWYLGTASVFCAMAMIARRRLFSAPLRCVAETYVLIEVFAALYLVFMLLNLWMITQRVMYLYHYFMGLMISYVLLALMWRYVGESRGWTDKKLTVALSGFAALVLASYMFFLPLTNHWPLTREQCERRNIGISHILDCR